MRLCECGCGSPTPPAKNTVPRLGLRKGEPVRYLTGHQTRRSAAPACGYVVDEDTGCWPWALGLNENGYGRVKVKGRCTYAHILAWERLHGSVPDGLELDHLCHNRACCNPDHLEVVTRRENVRRQRTTKVTLGLADEIRRATGSNREIAGRFDVSTTTVQNIRAGTRWVA